MTHHPEERDTTVTDDACCGPSGGGCCGSTPPLPRRDFIKLAGLAATGSAVAGLPAFAGPFEAVDVGETNDYLRLIPQDKQLDPAWERSLFERGEKATYSEPAEFKHIGMPVGGLFAGTVYLGGDGRLWLWDIFNTDPQGIAPRKTDLTFNFRRGLEPHAPRHGLNYVDPPPVISPVRQGFRLSVGGVDRSLDSAGFAEVTFDGRYPVGRVRYRDPECPIAAELTAYSPFMPLNLDDSSLPATVMSYELTNQSDEPVEATLAGYLANPVGLNSAKKFTGERRNEVLRQDGHTTLVCSASGAEKFEQQRDFGTMALTLLDNADVAMASAADGGDAATGSLTDSVEGTVGKTVRLVPGESVTVTFVIAWHFPNFYARGCGKKRVGHHYASRFDSAPAVAEYVAENFEQLSGTTLAWVETWYDSTLPYWLLDRSMANTSTLATTTCYRFEDGRFWAWEGIGCCQGTCTHVWHYAQAPGRLFPELERDERERVNFGLGMHDDGGIGMRTNLKESNRVADDGHCGRILGVLREHQMSADDAFLTRLWPKVRKALEFMIGRDSDGDGLLDGAQHNTLDAAWYGKISFTSSLFLAALRAGQQMATEQGDDAFAARCTSIADLGAKNLLETYNGEYFAQIVDPEHADAIGTGSGCYIDQVFGQTWAHWVGLGRLFDRNKQLSALRALWKYNFCPDVGPFREEYAIGRWYAMAGDAGLLMGTWPKGGERLDASKDWQHMYFNECMSGFEYQVAAHMVWEGIDQPDLLKKGLAVTRAVHDRYHAALRNPYNEVECSDHYSRAMASYGVYQAVTGFECHGPKGQVAFAPRLTPADFRCAFVTAEGWGTFSQTEAEGKLTAQVDVRHGRLKLNSLVLGSDKAKQATRVEIEVEGGSAGAKIAGRVDACEILLDSELVMDAGQSIRILLT